MKHNKRALAALLTVISATSAAHADTGSTTASLEAELEVDPLAYALSGHSLHIAMANGRYRVDLGAFALEIPEAFHGNKGFDASFAGFGAKFDVFLKESREGLFASADVALVRSLITTEDSGTQLAARALQPQFGGRVGYRFNVTEQAFISPWVGVGYAPGEDTELGGKTFKHQKLNIFPTVHLGYRF